MASLDEIMHAFTALEPRKPLPPIPPYIHEARDGSRWYEDLEGDSLPAGWGLSVKYEVEWSDDRTEVAVYILGGELNTGQQVIRLSPTEIDQPKYEALIEAEEYAAQGQP